MSPPVTATAPATSKLLCACSSFDSGTKRSERKKVAIPTGTLTKKIHGHDSVSTRIPPSSSPTAPPPTAIAAQTPSAFARSGPSLNVVVTIERAAGETSAAPSPCAPRATISHVSPFANPQSSDATVKSTRPARKTRLRPIRSPARPPSSRKPPKRSAYALTTHCRPDSDIPRSVWIDGSATFTIVASRITMNWARQTRTRTSHGLTRPAFTALDATGRPGVCAYGYP